MTAGGDDGRIKAETVRPCPCWTFLDLSVGPTVCLFGFFGRVQRVIDPVVQMKLYLHGDTPLLNNVLPCLHALACPSVPMATAGFR